MGRDDEYRAVSANEESADHLLEKSVPITRAAYQKRSLAASVMLGGLIGAGVMFLISIIFAPQSSSASAAPAATVTATATATVTSSVAAAAATSVAADAKASSADPYDDKDYITECGSNPTEARAKGCVFDVMMQLWTPPACYDSNLSERYLAEGNWTWWDDGEAKHTLTLDEMRKGEHTVIYVIQDYHKKHCIFAWEKMIRALRNDGPVIEELISIDHMTHCRHRTLDEQDASVRGVRAPTGYTKCAKYDTWLRHMPANDHSTTDK